MDRSNFRRLNHRAERVNEGGVNDKKLDDPVQLASQQTAANCLLSWIRRVPLPR